ncbi:MAG TPA: leucine--tRNA ligase [archaeon]|nr:leucine--tRNA ligase [archaeon]
MVSMDLLSIQKKVQAEWKAKRAFEADIDSKKKKFFITFPISYVNGGLHVGHAYSLFRTDTYARFKRMQGFNVVFPQGFHATGEPITGAVKRLRLDDQVQVQTFKDFGATDKDIEDFKKLGPEYVAKFWAKSQRDTMELAGISTDWRRTFITTDITPQFSRFIEWQYETLKKLGYVREGTHPVVWCPQDQSPTGDHDRLKGEGESVISYTLLKFESAEEKGTFFVAATLRPETIYGVTNMWVNPDASYVKVQVGNEKWIVSKYAEQKLKEQLKHTKILQEIDGIKLLGKTITDPISNRKISVLPAHFVDPENSTGVVMSVPAHAPYDWTALKELRDRGDLERYGVTRFEIEPISLIETEGLGDMPAVEICEKMGIKSTKEEDKLEKATSGIYKKEFHQGVLKDNCGKWSGKKVAEVKEKLIEEFKKRGIADELWETTGEVVCRCTTTCFVKILQNQWFVAYSDEKWKEKARKCLEKMAIYPEEARNNFLNTIDWLADKACTRKSGLGTKLPWNNEWIVETLSDSTIYMAYYTIARIITENKIDAKKLTNDVFDHIFLGKGTANDAAKASGLSKKLIEKMKEEFEYFYPVDMRMSGKDLLQHHLTFYMFQHAALFKEKFWPKGIAINGFVNVEGEKMSKSKGNVIPLKQLVESMGSDIVRMNLVGFTEKLDDADWRSENVKAIRNRVDFINSIIMDLKKMKRRESGTAEKNLLSKLQRIIQKSTEHCERTEFSSSVKYSFYEATMMLRHYLNRVGGMENADKATLEEFIKTIIVLNAPMLPHTAEHWWGELEGKGFISGWPKYNPKLVNVSNEAIDGLLMKVEEDIRKIIKTTTIEKPSKITLFISPSWKYNVYRAVMEGVGIKELMGNEEIRNLGKTAADYYNKLKKIPKLEEVLLTEKKEFEGMSGAKDYLQKMFGAGFEIKKGEGMNHPKALIAEPNRPGILIE